MIKEPKNVDFYTTGRMPSEKDFTMISDWIRKSKMKRTVTPSKKVSKTKRPTPTTKELASSML
jgi:Zn-dependent M16 (insulinase) family peptidase